LKIPPGIEDGSRLRSTGNGEAGIRGGQSGDLYVVIGDEQGAGAYAVRAYFNPLVRCIWLGALIMFLGGAVSLSDRRLRVGAPVKSRSAAAVPAE